MNLNHRLNFKYDNCSFNKIDCLKFINILKVQLNCSVVARLSYFNKIVEFYLVEKIEKCNNSYLSLIKNLKNYLLIRKYDYDKNPIVDIYYHPRYFNFIEIEVNSNKYYYSECQYMLSIDYIHYDYDFQQVFNSFMFKIYHIICMKKLL